MQDNLKLQINGVSNSSTDKLDEVMRQLKIQSEDDEDGGITANSTFYPNRPGEPDCIYFLRTGMCGYGCNCRFNHPGYIAQLAQYSSELPERPGQPDCQFFLKTGTCKFGATCKYHHSKDKNIARQAPPNVYGLPMRQDEKSCPYYMRTWSCKFGMACKFHHPQPAGVGTVLPVSGTPTYGSSGSSVVPSSGLSYVGGVPTWSLPGAPSIPGLPLQSSQPFMPLILSPSQGITLAQQRLNTYMGTVSPLSSTSSSTQHGESGSTGQQVGPLSESVPHYPERPEEPECQYYMKTGRCKYGSDCKYHHPKERLALLGRSNLGPFGLPLRPGLPVCTNYTMYGMCKFGSSCKFDHPWTGYYNYGVTMPALSVVDPSLYSNYSTSPEPLSLKISPSKPIKLSNPKQATSPQPTSSEHPHDSSE